MASAPRRFTQTEITRLLKAARDTGFECVSIEVLPGDGGLRATYSMASAAPDEAPSALEAWKEKRAKEKAREPSDARTQAAMVAPRRTAEALKKMGRRKGGTA